MNEGDVIEVLRNGFFATMTVAGPPLLAALITGVAVSFLQALTQIQEVTLSYVPKIVVTMVGDAARSSLATLRTAEATAARGVAGTADVQEVVQAAAAAELTVQTLTQLRDKVVGAYTDVLRMAV